MVQARRSPEEVEMSAARNDGVSYVERISYDDLYRGWEEGNWRATEIDFSKDREGWRALSEVQRKSALWTYSMFFYGEDSITDNLSPLHRRGAQGGAEVLPRHATGGRGPARRLLP